MGFFGELQRKFIDDFIVKDRYMELVTGLRNTVIITIFSLILGVAIGLILALFKIVARQNRKFKVLDIIADVYITVIRGTPVVLQLMIWFYVVLFFVSEPIPVAILGFGINSGAYVAEIFRAGIQSIDKGQMEAGRSLGLSYWATMRYIILPQAFKNVLPALGNEFIALLKETSVAGYISVHDLTRGAYNIRNMTYDSFLPLIASATIYLIMVMIISSLLSVLERRLRQGDRS
ncbi:amino acid ABC transporter permease [Clostridium thermosuccinogenes]|uniref:Amino acid ABC transporter permease n=2 Tax=Clostridium thermosuccinogenes TaxID=84032 RepID=A0A2K2FRE2_9CLOT|nr:amino acid ABC transporter permease [Pseudoclostridium thermosuccinogenes]AUS95733.1 amino acid ABC transporter permease [Pseudoclostridium thermosuccinogenes]PNT99907.1 amino acid ABC transporter permease [Pseudoclostridium thermosuccinogenes]PNU01352.1 amino acid ABC transporter permease [Pseudoclostridium thermosuccinogenes]